MTWFKVDDSLNDHPKVIALRRRRGWQKALALWTMAGSWSARHLTDGIVPREALQQLGATARVARDLLETGLWEDHDSGYAFHGWLERNPSKAQIESTREKTRERVQKHRSNAVTEPAVTLLPSRPVPSRPDPLSCESVQSAREPANDSQSDAMSLSEAKHRETRKSLRMEFSRRFQAAEGSPWTQASSPALDVLASWLIAMPDPTAAMSKALDGFFADAWCRSQHFPVAHLAKYPQKYFEPREAPSTAREPETIESLRAQACKLMIADDMAGVRRLNARIEEMEAFQERSRGYARRA